MTDIALRGGNLPDDEMGSEFLQGMVNRRLVGYRKYGSARAAKWDYVANIRARLGRYEEDGNTEWLVDAAVYAWLEFMYPRHPNAHFRATGSEESRGSLMTSGKTSHGEQTPVFHRHEGD